MTDIVRNSTQSSASGADILPLTYQDIWWALRRGVSDFDTAPLFGLFFGGIYALGGIAVLLAVFTLNVSYLAYPMVAGSVLIGPFVAAGLYEVSRQIEAGRTPTWRTVMGTMLAQHRRELSWMAFVTIFAFIIWMYEVRLLLALFLGFASFATLDEFARVLFTTSDGLYFLAVGHVVGAGLALGLFSITVISFPLLLDRDVDVVTAMITSVQTVIRNPGPMILWGAVVVALLALASVPAFLGLLVVLPILGHATWHLYRRAIAHPAG